MWVRKTEKEKIQYAREKRAQRKKLEVPAFKSLFIAIFTAGMYALGWRGWSLPASTMSLARMRVVLPGTATKVFLFVFALMVFMRRAGFDDESGNVRICTSCKHAQYPEKQCIRCGGALEPLADWRWEKSSRKTRG